MLGKVFLIFRKFESKALVKWKMLDGLRPPKLNGVNGARAMVQILIMEGKSRS